MSTITVNSFASLQQALNFARPGDTIALEPGQYGSREIRDASFAGNVTITSADPTHPARFQGLIIQQCSGLTLSDLHINLSQAPKQSRPFQVGSSSNIIITGLTVHGNPSRPPAGQAFGLLIGGSTNVTVSNSTFKSLTVGITQLNNSYINITNNVFHDLNARGVDGGGSDHVTISYNTVYNVYPTPGGLHTDGIMVWTNSQCMNSSNIKIVGNVMYRGAGLPFQGIFISAAVHSGNPVQNMLIKDNKLSGLIYDGIAINHANNVIISKNQIIAYTDERSSRLVLVNMSNVISHDNSYTSVVQTNVSGLTSSGNTISKPVPIPTESSVSSPWLQQVNQGSLPNFLASMANLQASGPLATIASGVRSQPSHAFAGAPQLVSMEHSNRVSPV